MRASALQRDDPSSDNRYDYRRSVGLVFDLGSATLSGKRRASIFGSGPTASAAPGVSLPGTPEFVIEGRRLVDGHFTATLRGVNENPDSAHNDTGPSRGVEIASDTILSSRFA